VLAFVWWANPVGFTFIYRAMQQHPLRLRLRYVAAGFTLPLRPWQDRRQAGQRYLQSLVAANSGPLCQTVGLGERLPDELAWRIEDASNYKFPLLGHGNRIIPWLNRAGKAVAVSVASVALA
jgi:hypothetical protein